MTANPRFATFIALALAAPALAACGEDASRATGTGTTATTVSEPAEVPDGVAAQFATLEEEVAEEGGSTETGDWRIAQSTTPPWSSETS